ncbi:MAG: transglycosylase SLT domain-containing protein [Acidobacteria bacterium]|nr:transglycosylase SLT domain-containing protein [Acidobacteriota bacterium]
MTTGRGVIVSVVASVMAIHAPAAVPSIGGSVTAQESTAFEEIMPLDDFSPAILGIFRKLMLIEEDIERYASRYQVDFDLARATCMYESGGNANLTSWAGAKGYFQVMPATFRGLNVDTNIEAGIKYIGQLIRQFEREDYALAAYNGGPGNVGRGRAMRLESLQYVLGVGYYRTMLKLHGPSIRHHASGLELTEVRDGEEWWDIAERLNISLLQLRLHNPYLAVRRPKAGQFIAYPPVPRDNLFEPQGDHLEYRSRLGDNYFNVAFTLDVELDDLRAENELWHLQTLPTGMLLRIPLTWEDDHSVHRVRPGDTVAAVAEEFESTPWRILRDNGLLWDSTLDEGMMLRVREVPKPPQFVTHRVRSGENLSRITTARRSPRSRQPTAWAAAP